MIIIKTIKLKLDCRAALIEPTIQAYTRGFNYTCSVGYNKTTNGVKLHHLTYKILRESLPSQLAISARMKATQCLKAKPKKCPNSKQCSIRLDARSYNVWFDKNEASILTINGRQKLKFNIPKCFEQYLSWKRTSADLFIRNGKVFLNIVFQTEKSNVDKTDNFYGVDRGIKNHVVISNNKFLGGKYIWKVKQKYQKLRSVLQSKKHSGKRHFNKIKNKENRFMRNVNHVISKRIVKMFKPGDTIVLEKLTNIKNNSRRFRKTQRKQIHQWSYYQLEQFLKYKAEAKGIYLAYIDARYTSQRCYKCGHVKRSNRNKSWFKCKQCGFTCNADLNASKNIINKYLESIGHPNRVTSTNLMLLSG